MPHADRVSVVIQGPVSQWTEGVITSVERHLPFAQIILSTWSGTTLPDAAARVRVVLSDDPGPGPEVRNTSGGVLGPWNTNRMLVSTRAGLAVADRPYVLKLRTDSPLTSAAVVGWDSLRTEPGQRIFTERIATCSVATRPPSRTPGHLHHPSDCVQFGTTADLLHLWGDDPFDEVENIGYWSKRNLRAPMTWDARLVNEQVVWLSCLERSRVKARYPYAGAQVTEGTLRQAQDLMFANFVVLEPWQLGVALPKLEPMIASSAPESYTWFDDWLSDRPS